MMKKIKSGVVMISIAATIIATLIVLFAVWPIFTIATSLIYGITFFFVVFIIETIQTVSCVAARQKAHNKMSNQEHVHTDCNKKKRTHLIFEPIKDLAICWAHGFIFEIIWMVHLKYMLDTAYIAEFTIKNMTLFFNPIWIILYYILTWHICFHRKDIYKMPPTT